MPRNEAGLMVGGFTPDAERKPLLAGIGIRVHFQTRGNPKTDTARLVELVLWITEAARNPRKRDVQLGEWIAERDRLIARLEAAEALGARASEAFDCATAITRHMDTDHPDCSCDGDCPVYAALEAAEYNAELAEARALAAYRKLKEEQHAQQADSDHAGHASKRNG